MCVAGACTGLQIPHIQGGFFAPPCPPLHRIAFAVVSEWCQEAVNYASRVVSNPHQDGNATTGYPSYRLSDTDSVRMGALATSSSLE